MLQIKQALQEKEGIHVDQIRLVYSGKQIADDKTIVAKIEIEKAGGDAAHSEMVFYDSAAQKPLFVAPRGRSWGAFLEEARLAARVDDLILKQR